MGASCTLGDRSVSWAMWSGGKAAASARQKPQPWDIALAKDPGTGALTASFSYPYYQHGALVRTAVGEFYGVSITAPYVGVKVKPLDGTAEIVQGANLADITETDVEGITDTVRLPLYVFDDELKGVVADIRRMPGTGAYW